MNAEPHQSRATAATFVQGHRSRIPGFPAPVGLYDPRFEHDSCGVGMVVHMKGKASHKIIEMGLEMLENMNHRGITCGCEENSGDGAGVMASLPDKFFRKEATKWGFKLPKAGEYGVAMCFLPKDLVARQESEQILEERVVKSYGMTVLGWRDVPTNENFVGPTPKTMEPRIRQCFIGMGEAFYNRRDFNRRKCLSRSQQHFPRAKLSLEMSPRPRRKFSTSPA